MTACHKDIAVQSSLPVSLALTSDGYLLCPQSVLTDFIYEFEVAYGCKTLSAIFVAEYVRVQRVFEWGVEKDNLPVRLPVLLHRITKYVGKM